jgi:hypothetical protein
MGYPLKTSDDKWLKQALELVNKRISISIIDDAHYNLNINSDCIRIFNKYSLSYKELTFLGLFYALSLLCAILLYLSTFLQYTKNLGLVLSFLGFIVCFSIPTYYLRKNRSPHISPTESGVDIIFSSRPRNNLEDVIYEE